MAKSNGTRILTDWQWNDVLAFYVGTTGMICATMDKYGPVLGSIILMKVAQYGSDGKVK